LKSKRFIPISASIVAILSLSVLTGCCEAPLVVDQAQNSLHTVFQTQDAIQENHQQSTSGNNAVQQYSVHQISSQKAREIAVEFVGYGVVHDIQAFTDENTLIFEIDIRYDAMRYVVLLNAESGNVTSLKRYADGSIDVVDSPDAYIVTDASTAPNAATSPDSTAASNPAASQTENRTQTTNETTQPATQPATQSAANPPSSPAVTSPASGRVNRPSNPAISLDRAIEIAYADLASRGIDATYRSNSGMEWERGQWVWELLFRTHGERMPLIEYYINVDNGNIAKFEWDD